MSLLFFDEASTQLLTATSILARMTTVTNKDIQVLPIEVKVSFTYSLSHSMLTIPQTANRIAESNGSIR